MDRRETVLGRYILNDSDDYRISGQNYII
jgi:hypothetical protein